MYDEALLGILNKEGQIQPFLNVIFGFLHRRTDFFKPLTPDGKYGFPPNVALNMVRSICLHYANLNNRYSSAQIPQQSVPSSASSPATSTTTSTSSSSNRKKGSETRQQSLEGLIKQPILPNSSTTPSLQSNTVTPSLQSNTVSISREDYVVKCYNSDVGKWFERDCSPKWRTLRADSNGSVCHFWFNLVQFICPF